MSRSIEKIGARTAPQGETGTTAHLGASSPNTWGPGTAYPSALDRVEPTLEGHRIVTDELGRQVWQKKTSWDDVVWHLKAGALVAATAVLMAPILLLGAAFGERKLT
jgi:hypothetical protein